VVSADPADPPPPVSSHPRRSIDPNILFRKLILSATQNRAVKRIVSRHGMRLGAARFVAGETLEECIATLRRLEETGLHTNTTLLGEHVDDAEATRGIATTYLEVLDRIAQAGLKTNVALKLTHLGLDYGEALAAENVERIVAHAATRENFIRIDMEESERVDPTLRIYGQLLERGHTNVGTVLQAYLYRTQNDLTNLLPLRPNLRLVKGAYLEPASVAYPQKKDVDAQLARLIERSLSGDGHTAVATHDDAIIEHTIAFAREHGIPNDRFEFQMLFGVRSRRQRELVARGFKVLVATPYGPDWYPYLMRRLAERPANAAFMLRNALRR
jgi:proline dehydrogenase